MSEIAFDPVDTVTAGAVGPPGRRTFLLQAVARGDTVTILVEKGQMEVLGVQLAALLARLGERAGDVEAPPQGLVDAPPLFRALALGLGYEPPTGRFVLEAAEQGEAERDEASGHARTVRWSCTAAQARHLVAAAGASVASGRPLCELCRMPKDPDGHVCPASNGHGR